MSRRKSIIAVMALAVAAIPLPAQAQFVDDGSGAELGKANIDIILRLIHDQVKNAEGAKVTVLRRSKGSLVCGSVNVKNVDGFYLGERGFVVDLAIPSFGRLPEGPELMNPNAPGFAEMERIRALYFAMCLD